VSTVIRQAFIELESATVTNLGTRRTTSMDSLPGSGSAPLVVTEGQ